MKTIKFNSEITNQEKLDAFSDIETMMENDCYTLVEAVDHISKGYGINAFQLGLWFANYKNNN